MAAALAASWLLGSATARAQVTSEPSAVIFPDPAKFARGFYTEGEVGAVTFFGPASSAVAPGFAVGARFGYDIFRFFALQLHALGSTHQTKGDTPFSGQLLQTYQGTMEGKLTIRFVQFSIFAEGGIGAARMSTNLLYALGYARYRTGSRPAAAPASTTTRCPGTFPSGCAAATSCCSTSATART
jgi:hypothetical protein